jgi:hypothetical protein
MTWNATEEAWAYTYSVPAGATVIDAVFHDSNNNWDNNNGADWHLPVAAGEPGQNEFVIDGTLDAGVEIAASSTNITLWADWNGMDLYLATQRAQGSANDKFLFVAGTPGTMRTAPWAKAGQVANWSAYLAEEASNGWNGWFDNSGVTANMGGGVLEGTINLLQEINADVTRVWVCVGAYVSSDGGALALQAPGAVVANGNIEASEWVELILQPDSLVLTPTPTTIEIAWSPVFGANSYRIYVRTDSDGDIIDTVQTEDNFYSDPLTRDRAFYEVRAIY